MPTHPSAQSSLLAPAHSQTSEEDEDEELDGAGDQRRYSRRTRQTVQRYSPPKGDEPQLAHRSGGGGGDRRRGYQQDRDDSDDDEEVGGWVGGWLDGCGRRDLG